METASSHPLGWTVPIVVAVVRPACRLRPVEIERRTEVDIEGDEGGSLGFVATLVKDPPPAGFEALLEERRRLDQDRRDEVWDGVLHMIPPASHAHEELVMTVGFLLRPYAKARGMTLTGSVAIGTGKENYRAPDLAMHRPGAAAQWHPTAAVVVEILSPDDDTWKKLPFYAERGVDELVVVDLRERTVQWLSLDSGEYRPVERSSVIDLRGDELAGRIDWPE